MLVANGCHQAITILKAAVAVMATNKDISTELTALREEVARLAASHTSVDTQATTTASPPIEKFAITGDGSGAGSPEVYQKMKTSSWSGRLGRTHMVYVDKMEASTRTELDCYLRRTINKMFPVGAAYSTVMQDTVFATLAAFGLRLEDRGPLADVTIFSDSNHQDKATLSRIRNFSACYYSRGNDFENYWRASAMETLIELARYRGLFNSEGFLL